ncbi:MAG: carbamoyl phosphate synthase small subunit, partial [Firmicutes bacterium]|nr:carbamoyl phosphate synthase small subunit [Bacillota bacterium]
TCEGVEYTDMPAFTVQFHPEACGGPRDTAFLFDRFIDLMKEGK